MDLIWPPSLRMSSIEWGIEGNTAAVRGPLSGTMRTYSRPGGRLTARVTVQNASGAERAQLQALVHALRGQANRLYLADLSSVRRGTFPATQLLANADFSNGTTGWTFTNATGAAADGVLRLKRTTLPGGVFSFGQQALTGLTQFAPYAGRVHVPSASLSESQVGVSIFNGTPVSVGAAGNLFTAGGVLTTGTTANLYLDNTRQSGPVVGDFWDVDYTSFSRAFLVDNGVNVWDRAEELDNAAWTKFQATITANAFTSHDGTAATADRIVETTSTSEHYVGRSYTKSAAPARYCGWAILGVGTLANARTRARLTLYAASGADSIIADVNLATGAVITGPTAAGTFVNGQVIVKSMGSGWYLFEVLGTTGSETAVAFSINLMNGASVSYAGSTTGDISCAGIGLAPSGVAVRPVRTTTVAAASGTAQAGSALHVKGGPASLSGALLRGDMVEIVLPTYSHLARLTSALDFDAAGLGYMLFEPPLPQAPTDGAAIIVHEPMGRFMLSEDSASYSNEPGRFSDFSLDLVQDIVS
jgi:hypothetical protein